ncbi:TPA: helix-turn-helix transcriptional regulator, partial [Klebsiella pneumoniae]|nr:helix-turn-helix transcriptional regulator [Klebsiella pneumoniae]
TNIMVGYHQTNQKTDTGKTLTRWPVFVDHFNGMLARTVLTSTPPGVEYSLTSLGYSLADHVRLLAEWTVKHQEIIKRNRLHYDSYGKGSVQNSVSR